MKETPCDKALLAEPSAPSSAGIAPGDLLSIVLDVDVLTDLQRGHGGWNEAMYEAFLGLGVSLGTDKDGDVHVLYSSGRSYYFNPLALTKLHMGSWRPTGSCIYTTSFINTVASGISSSPNGIQFLDMVKLCEDADQLKRLQEGHGGFSDDMLPIIGKSGTVKLVLVNGDIAVSILGRMKILNPLALEKTRTSPLAESRLTGDHLSHLGLCACGNGGRSGNNSSSGYRFWPFGSKTGTCAASHEFSDSLEKSASFGDLAKCQELLKRLDEKGKGVPGNQKALHAACLNGHTDVVKLLLDAGLNAEYEHMNKNRPIHAAAMGGSLEVVTLLTERGADLNQRNKFGCTPLHIAVYKGHINVVMLLLDLDCHPSLQGADGDTPMHIAIMMLNVEIVRLLFERNANLCLANKDGCTLLHYAAIRDNQSIISLLLESLPCKSLVDEKKDDGFTALHMASLNNNLQVAQLLIHMGGANVNIPNNQLHTPLHLAVLRKHIDVVKLLIREGASVNVKDEDGDTALHCCLFGHRVSHIQKNNVNATKCALIAKELLANGADLTIRNKKQKVPLDLCLDSNLSLSLTESYFNHAGSKSRTSVISSNSVETGEMIGNECMVCSENKPDTMFLPCNHMITCNSCSVKVKRCLKCRQDVTGKVKIEECVVCTDKMASVQFSPCGHVCVCEDCSARMKKCIQCRVPLDSKTGIGAKINSDRNKNDYLERDGSNLGNNCTQEKRSSDTESEQQLPSSSSKSERPQSDCSDNENCPVCLYRARNMAFLCGHRVCQFCGDRLEDCPICRKKVQSRILLY